MAAAAPPEVKKIGMGELRAYLSDPGELKKGTAIFDAGGLSGLSRFENKLYCDAKGSDGRSVYKVSLAYTDALVPEIKARCSCPAATRGGPARTAYSASFCKHGAALLVAWTRAPESFLVSEGAPGGDAGAAKKKRSVKAGKVDTAALRKAGVEQVSTLVRELGVSGIAATGGDRLEQIQTLGAGLRDNKLIRLGARTLDLARLLKGALGTPAGVPAVPYTDLMADLLLTGRKLEKHLAGEPLDDRHVEELVGKTWQKGDRKPVADLDLVEYAFSTWTTSDDYVIRESRFFDTASGRHYSEKQIVPAFLRRTEPKPSRSGQLLSGARGTTFPGYSPFRIQFDDLGDKRPVDDDVLALVVERALPDVGAALAALQEHRKDVFAPDRVPVALRVDTLFARGLRMQAVDDKGHALHLPPDPALEERLAGSLHEARLRAVLGDVGIDAALPTLWPVAAIIEGPLGLSLRPVTPQAGEARPAKPAGAAWGDAAREAGASPAAILLGEVREELADAFVAGLAGLSPRRTEPLAAKLTELGLTKQAALLRSIPAKPEPADRLDDFIKLYQILEIALVRLSGATHVDRATMARVPTYESVCVAAPEEPLSPHEVTRRRAAGTMSRYVAAIHYARHYEALPAEALAEDIFPIWADGSAGPYIAKTFAARGAEALRAVEKALKAKAGRVARMTGLRVLLAVAAQGGAHRPAAEQMLEHVARNSKDAGLRAMARDGLDALDAARAGGAMVRKRRAEVLEKVAELSNELISAPNQQERGRALRQLSSIGNLAAVPALRQAFFNDAARGVREDAAHALAHLGDTDMVETFVRMLASRGEDDQEAKVAAYALGYLGDVRGLNELLSAYAEAYKPGIVADAIRAFGAVALEPLIDLIEGQPELSRRATALDVLKKMDEAEVASALLARLEARRGAADVADKAALYVKLADAHHHSKREVAYKVMEILKGDERPEAVAAVRAARRALGVILRE